MTPLLLIVDIGIPLQGPESFEVYQSDGLGMLLFFQTLRLARFRVALRVIGN